MSLPAGSTASGTYAEPPVERRTVRDVSPEPTRSHATSTAVSEATTADTCAGDDGTTLSSRRDSRGSTSFVYRCRIGSDATVDQAARLTGNEWDQFNMCSPRSR